MSRASRPIRRLCVQWARLGPYHLARLAAAHARAVADGRQIVALETASGDATYAWVRESAQTPFPREIVFPDRVFEEIDAATIHRGIIAALDRIDPDAVAITSYSTPDARACLLWCRKKGRPAILMTETKEDDADRIGWREAVKRSLVGLYDAALVGGSPHQAYFEKLGVPPASVFQGFDAVDNRFFADGADAARRSPAAWAHLPGLADPAPYFLASNRFVARKNLDRLVRAYGAYRRQTATPWRLLLLGDGAERPALEALLRREAIEGVVFCGFRQIDELPAYYGLAGAFVHPALVEQWGLVVNEAMAAGLPVLVSERAGCARDLIRNGVDGYTFDPTDTPELTRLLGLVAGDTADRAAMGAAARETIALWSPDRFARGLWDAAEYAGSRPPASAPIGDALLWTIQRLGRRVHSFHSLRD
ncbi:MAG: glycosyltransferase [Rhodothermales bacterium]